MKVLTSADGSSFEEAAAWRSLGREEASYVDTVMFEEGRTVQAVAVVMRSPSPWGYYGLSDVALLAEPGPMVLVSGLPSRAGELCLVSDAEGVRLQSCLVAIAGGAGGEAFVLNERSQLVSMSDGRCVSLARGDAAGGGKVVAQDCAGAAMANDGRSEFELAPGGQLRFKFMGGFCLAGSVDGAYASPCGAEAGGAGAPAFFPAAVGALDASGATLAKDAAALLNAAAARQTSLAAKVQAAAQRLPSCGLKLGQNASAALSGGASLAGSRERASGGPSFDAISHIYTSLGVDAPAIARLIAESSAANSAISASLGGKL